MTVLKSKHYSKKLKEFAFGLSYVLPDGVATTLTSEQLAQFKSILNALEILSGVEYHEVGYDTGNPKKTEPFILTMAYIGRAAQVQIMDKTGVNLWKLAGGAGSAPASH